VGLAHLLLLLRRLDLEVNGLRRDDAIAFLYGDELIGMDITDGVLMTVRPVDLEFDSLVRVGFAEAKGERQLALREIT